MLVAVVGCDARPHLPAAPIGDHGVLEQLADAYRTISQQYPVQPGSMRPAGKKEFVERVFATAGYSYTATLMACAQRGIDMTNQDQRDLAELLFLPHKGLADADMGDLYSADELSAIRTIQAILN